MLAAPPANFTSLSLALVAIDPAALVRVTRFPDTEPYFGKSGGSRFDDPLQGYGVCYAGDSLIVAFAESVLHDAEPQSGAFHIDRAAIENRYVVIFDSGQVDLADLTGASLKRIGGSNDLSSETPYLMPQQWSRATHDHPHAPDGLRYVSRHMNTGFAFALFDRARQKVRRKAVIPLRDHADLSLVLEAFNVHLY